MNPTIRIPRTPARAACLLAVFLVAGTAFAIDQPPETAPQQRAWLLSHLVTDMQSVGSFTERRHRPDGHPRQRPDRRPGQPARPFLLPDPREDRAGRPALRRPADRQRRGARPGEGAGRRPADPAPEPDRADLLRTGDRSAPDARPCASSPTPPSPAGAPTTSTPSPTGTTATAATSVRSSRRTTAARTPSRSTARSTTGAAATTTGTAGRTSTTTSCGSGTEPRYSPVVTGATTSATYRRAEGRGDQRATSSADAEAPDPFEQLQTMLRTALPRHRHPEDPRPDSLARTMPPHMRSAERRRQAAPSPVPSRTPIPKPAAHPNVHAHAHAPRRTRSTPPMPSRTSSMSPRHASSGHGRHK